MKKLLTMCLIAAGALAGFSKEIKEFVVTTTPQMSCSNCENKIKGNLRFEKGVKKVQTDLQNQCVIVTYDADQTNEDKLTEAFGKINYQVAKTSKPGEEVCPQASENACASDSTACPKKKSCCSD